MNKFIRFSLVVILFVFCFGGIMTEKSDAAEQYKSIVNISEVRASHILVKTKDEALKLKNDIENGKISFEDAAKQYSSCPSGRNGGDLGYFSKGQMVKPFEDAAFSMKKGEISEPVQTQFGWHLIQLTDVEE